MMNRTFLLIMSLVASCSSYADAEDIWLYLRLKGIDQEIEGLKTQITNIPQGKQGERGLPGAPGARGEKGEPGHYTAGEGISIEGNVIKVLHKTHQIGEFYRGGIIFWLDETGEHGLIASIQDINHGQGMQWRNGASGNKVTNARADGVGAGETNTRLIISQQTIDNQRGTFAALQASNFQVLEDGVTPCKTPMSAETMCYGGWYLPSALELQLIHKNLHLTNFASFAPEYYWSSTEHNVSDAWLVQFATGELISSNKSNTVGKVRAIARF